MFTPSEIERMPIEIERIMSELEIRIMEDIVRRIRINDEITRSADWQIYRLNQLGENKLYIKKQIRITLGLSRREVNKLYKDVIAEGYARDEKLYKWLGKRFTPYHKNLELQQLVSSVMEQTVGSFENITNTLGFAIDINSKRVFTPLSEYLRRTLDRAVLEVATGTFDYNSTLKRVVSEMTKSGLRTVGFESGYTNRIEVAVRRALMTGVTQVTNHINDRNAEELGTDKFEVSWHATARPEHQVWQGRVYTKEELTSICGLGSVTGLLGANCYHSYYPFIPGISKRQWTDAQLDEMNAQENAPKAYMGKEFTTYEATQRQRYMETLMRAQRRKIKLLKSGNGPTETIEEYMADYQDTMRKYRLFSKSMGLPQQMERVYVDGLKKVG